MSDANKEFGVFLRSMKRLLDLVLACIGVIVLAPLFAGLALLVKLDSSGPVFYRGVRVGQAGRLFRIFKLRTMLENAENLGAASTAADDSRLTRVGAFLRDWKLDELPQLFNVIRGEMSLVGPRPQVPWAVELYTTEERALLSVRPGLTDDASLYFRNEGEILRGSRDPDQDYLERIHPVKMRLSLEYVRRRSFWVDCDIVMRTLAAVICRRQGEVACVTKEDDRITDSASR